MEIVNATPHAIDIYTQENFTMIRSKSIPASGWIIRITEDKLNEDPVIIDGIEVIKKNYGHAVMIGPGSTVSELPPTEPGRYFIVSLPVALAIPRPDFLVADGTVRDKGVVCGCERLAVVTRGKNG